MAHNDIFKNLSMVTEYKVLKRKAKGNDFPDCTNPIIP